MKLAILGGGGVRSPFLAKFVARKVKTLGISRVVFMDNDAEKLRVFGGLCKKIAKLVNPELVFTLTTYPKEAITDASIIITSMRVGQDKCRTLDERIALKYGVIGQETTGPGGFGMALRSIPALEKYCALAKIYARPDAMVFSFTNPSGLVTQYLRDVGYDNVYGVCDGPSGYITEVARKLELDYNQISTEWLGLNHLSWLLSVEYNNIDILPEVLKNPVVRNETELKIFDGDLIDHLQIIPNAYLMYYYHRERSLDNIVKSDRTRGETIQIINEKMFAMMQPLDPETDFERMLQIFLYHLGLRHASYMSIESGHSSHKVTPIEEIDVQAMLNGPDDESYAGIALAFADAKFNNFERELVLNIPNNGVIPELADGDVIETTCIVGPNGAVSKVSKRLPETALALVRSVKLYERLAARAIREKSRSLAIDALMVHPLVSSYSVARNIVDEYLTAYSEYIGNGWH